MSKTVKIDLSDDRLIAIAADMVDEHNYIGALKMLNKNAEITGNDEDSYMLYAEIFDDLGLYEKSVHHWFKFMDLAEFGDMGDCLEGLAVGYMNMGNEQFSAYYYDKLLAEGDELDAETRRQIVTDFLSSEQNHLKFVYPPEIADVSDVLTEGVGLMKAGRWQEAQEKFSLVPEGNPKWGAAQNYIAMCLVILDKTDEAEKICTDAVEKLPQSVEALTTLAAIKTQAGKFDEAKKITERLLSIDSADDDDIYKIATVCCENRMHAEAYKLFSKMQGEFLYDLNVLYFKAVSAFNSGQYERSFDEFDKLSTIYPDAVTAQYWQRVARFLYDENRVEELEYFYSLPHEVKEDFLKLLAKFLKAKKGDAMRLADELDVLGAVKWCFEETENSEDLHRVASRAAVKARYDDYVRDLLLHPTLSDTLKIEILENLAMRQEENRFGVVIYNIYRRVPMRKIITERPSRSKFVEAYSKLVSHFGIIDESYGEKFAAAAEELYARLKFQSRLNCAKDGAALSAVIYLESGVNERGLLGEKLLAFFGVTQERIDKIRGEE